MKIRLLLNIFVIVYIILFFSKCSKDEGTNPTQIQPQLDTTPPTTPTNLQGIKFLRDYVSIQWSPSTDNVGIAGYRIKRDGLQIGLTQTTTYVDSLTPVWIPIQYTVIAFDSSNNFSLESVPLQMTVILEAQDVAGSWGGSLQMTDPLFWDGGLISFTITANGNLTGALTDGAIATPSGLNPGAWSLGSSFNTGLTGKWIGQTITIQVESDSINQNMILDGGLIIFNFNNSRLAVGTYELNGRLRNDAANITFAWATGTCEAVRNE